MGQKNQPHKSKKVQSQVKLTPKMQKWFLIFIALNWFATLVAPFINLLGTSYKIDKGFMFYLGLQSLLPIIYGLCTIPFVWRHYTGLMRRLFMAGFIGLIGLISYGALSSVESAVRYRWFAPGAYTSQPSFWQSYGHDTIFMSLSLAAFVAVLGLWDYRLLKRAGK